MARDLSLAAQARARLHVDPSTRGQRLAVTAADGRLTVVGTVSSDELRDKVLEMVGGILRVAAVTEEVLVIRMPQCYPTT